jgi:UDP-N-acetylmuramoylalanine--D-glutamate ligase
MIPVSTFAGRRVAVFGLGASGNATALALVAGGAEVAAWDDGAASREAAAKAGVPIVDLTAADWASFAALVLAPGVPLTHPEPHWTVLRARAAGIEIIGDVELFFREHATHGPKAPVIAITGTNGKSTTTALTAHVLRTAGLDVQMGGNIGVPVLALEPPRPDRFYVLELSSFQIDLTTDEYLRPSVGVLLNITPDHLDRHGPANDAGAAMANYAAIKKRLVDNAEVAIVGIEDGLAHAGDLCEAIFHSLDHGSRGALAFTRKRAQVDRMVFNEGGKLRRLIGLSGTAGLEEVLVDLRPARALRGSHNAENASAAFLISEWLGLPHDEIGAAIKTYPGLPHRMEEVGRDGKVLFINDSKATNADSTDKALASWDRDIFWILGGKPKEGGISTLAGYFPRIAKAYLIGQATDEFATALEGRVAYERCITLDVALTRAAADARQSTGPEPVVLLSPACASYDQFKSFEHRGNAFREMVAKLPGVALPSQGEP